MHPRVRVNLIPPVKRRRALVATNPIKEKPVSNSVKLGLLPSIQGRPQECPIVSTGAALPLKLVMTRENEIFLCQ
jgi:hypothetical protein